MALRSRYSAKAEIGRRLCRGAEGAPSPRGASLGFAFAKTDHFIVCSNFRASPSKA